MGVIFIRDSKIGHSCIHDMGRIIECIDNWAGIFIKIGLISSTSGISSGRDAFDINSSNPFPGNSTAISSLSKLRKGGREREKSLSYLTAMPGDFIPPMVHGSFLDS